MSYWILTISCVNVQDKQNTGEYLLQIRNFDEILADILEAKDQELNTANVTEWNQLSLDENDHKFFYEFNKVVNDEIIPNADDEHKPPSQDGSNTEQTPETLNSYVDTEVAMPMGLYSEFFTPR